MSARIQILSDGDNRGISFTLDKESYSLGRSDSCDVCISDGTISGHHATLFQKAGEYYLRDDGSTNGTRLNGAPIEAGTEHKLSNGDIFQCGSIEILFDNGEEFRSAAREATVINLENTGTGTVAAAKMSNMGTRAEARKKDHLRDNGKQKIMWMVLFGVFGLALIGLIIYVIGRMFG